MTDLQSLVRRRQDCRLCGSRDLVAVLSLTPTPPANAFVPEARRHAPQQVFPLDVFFCGACHHVQLLDVVDPGLLFEDYVYVSGTSPVFVRHFVDYAATLSKRFGPFKGKLAVEIGSNDGTMLRALREHGLAVVGVDPARDIAAKANAEGIPTLPAFFDAAVARQIKAEHGPAALVIANNVFAHADNLGEIADSVRDLLGADGVFAFEVSYLADVIEKTLFDTIYHEHLAYHTVAPLVRFFAAHGLELFAVERVDTHGGSLRGYVQRAGAPRARDGSVEGLAALERSRGLDRPETFERLGREIDCRRNELVALLRGLKAGECSVAAYGAPAKATTLSYHFGLDAGVIDFVVDDSPLKQGLFTPGLHIPVLPSTAIDAQRPAYLLILAWNFAESIIAKNEVFRSRGGRFIIPLPNLSVR